MPTTEEIILLEIQLVKQFLSTRLNLACSRLMPNHSEVLEIFASDAFSVLAIYTGTRCLFWGKIYNIRDRNHLE